LNKWMIQPSELNKWLIQPSELNKWLIQPSELNKWMIELWIGQVNDSASWIEQVSEFRLLNWRCEWLLRKWIGEGI